MDKVYTLILNQTRPEINPMFPAGTGFLGQRGMMNTGQY